MDEMTQAGTSGRSDRTEQEAVGSWLTENAVAVVTSEASALDWLTHIGGGAAQGAATGSIAGPWGALAGAILGGVLGAAQTASQPDGPSGPAAAAPPSPPPQPVGPPPSGP